MSDAADARTIELAWDLPHPPAKVWRALTEPALLAQWLLPGDLEPQVGHRFSFKAEPTPWWDGIVDSEVLELEAGRRIQYAWRTQGGKGLDTQVTWTLTPIASGTRLGLLHTGFKPGDAFAFQGAGAGWARNVSERMSAVLAALAG